MRILITGATGLVGQALTRLLLQKKYEVYFLTTNPKSLNALPGATGFLWDPSAQTIDSKCFEEVQAIIHLAGTSISIPWTTKNRASILDSRVQTIHLLHQAYQEFPRGVCQKFISASAIGIYPSHPKRLWKEEDQEPPQNFLQQVVSQWEAAVLDISETIPTTIRMRIGLVLANEGGVFPTLKIPTQWGLGAAFGNGEQYQSWIHIKDLANAFVHAVDHLTSGVFNAVAPQPVTQNTLIKVLGKTLNRPAFLPNIPAIMMRFVLGERSQLVLNSQRVSSQKLEASGFSFEFDSLESALAALIKNK